MCRQQNKLLAVSKFYEIVLVTFNIDEKKTFFIIKTMCREIIIELKNFYQLPV